MNYNTKALFISASIIINKFFLLKVAEYDKMKILYLKRNFSLLNLPYINYIYTISSLQ